LAGRRAFQRPQPFLPAVQPPLPSDEDNIAGLCGFLGSEAGRVLRIDGLEWLAATIRAKPDAGAWYREGTDGWLAAGLPLEEAIPEPRPDE